MKHDLPKLNDKDQIAYLSERGNVIPAMEALEKQRDEQIRTGQRLTDDIKAFFNAKKASDERAGVHTEVVQMVGDRSRVKETDTL